MPNPLYQSIDRTIDKLLKENFMYRRSLVAIAFLSIFAAATAQTRNDWTVYFQQGSKKISAQAQTALKKAPFEIVFQGPKNMGYAVLASEQCDEMANLTSQARIDEVLRPTSIGAEKGDRTDRELMVNAPGLVKASLATAQLWAEDTENDNLAFQKFEPNPQGRATATREINAIFLFTSAPNGKVIPIARYPGAQICVLLSGMPPAGKFIHSSPQIFKLAFE
jgi:hypothetical protein